MLASGIGISVSLIPCADKSLIRFVPLHLSLLPFRSRPSSRFVFLRQWRNGGLEIQARSFAILIEIQIIVTPCCCIVSLQLSHRKAGVLILPPCGPSTMRRAALGVVAAQYHAFSKPVAASAPAC